MTQATTRVTRSKQNHRGRKNPARVPAKLTRTPAFAPRSQGLITDSNFERIYVMPGHSIVKIKGRELGSKHRDALYALFRLRPQRVQPNTDDPERDSYYQVRTTWRELLTLTGKQHHRNNLKTILTIFEHFQMVVIEVQYGKPDALLDAEKIGQLGGPGFSENILRHVQWTGEGLDDSVTIQYGSWVRNTIVHKQLVSLNAEVQFALTSDYAKSFWPFIDSQPRWRFIDESKLAELAGIDLWPDDVSRSAAKQKRGEFRRLCLRAFDDMVKAGGLKSWRMEVTGDGRHKSRRYHYVHALPSQYELALPGTL